MTKKQKAEEYDGIKAQYDKYSLAFYDLANGRFGAAKRYSGDWIKQFEDALWHDGAISVQMSWRGMPLYMVSCRARGAESQIFLYTDSEIQDMTMDTAFARVLKIARNELLREQRTGAA